MRKLFIYYNFLIVLGFLFFIPGIGMILNQLFDINFNKYYNNPLWGGIEKIDRPRFNLKNFTSHSIQRYYENIFTNTLPLRTLTIRLNNQIYYSFFNKSYSYNNQIIIGKNNQLFELPYINNYCWLNGPPYSKKYLVNWANRLEKLNIFFTKRGKKFIYVITPSKAEYLPAAIPNRFHCNKKGISPHVETLEMLLSNRGVPYVSGPHLMVEATKKYKTSMFPQGGTHWNYLAGGITANTIIKTINQLGPPTLIPLSFDYILDKNPEGTDTDLTNLLNLFKPNKHYVVPKLNFKPSPSINPVTLAIIGDSFTDQYLDAFVKGGTFEKIFFYRYFKYSKTEYTKNSTPIEKKVNLDSAQVLDSILSADVVLLEENTYNTISEHATLFYKLMDKLVLNST